MYDEDESEYARLGTTIFDDGGLLTLAKGGVMGGTGVLLTGNAHGSGEPRMGLFGNSRELDLDMTLEGDASVKLPEDAINSSEILDEVGVASAINPTGTNMRSSV